MDLTVFYAWQSDRPENYNRYLIRDAAKTAVKRIVNDADIDESPRLDHDTKDVPGLIELANTIFKKIETCGLFLADLTFIGTSVGQQGKASKTLPNPNVLLELGYAARSVGWERMIAVMNTAYGQPDELIFDLLHRRWPIVFELKEDEDHRKPIVKAALASEIERWIRGVIKSEHAAVEDAIKSVDVDCLKLMKEAGKFEFFSEPTELDGRFLYFYTLRKLATLRLLDLRMIEARHDPRQDLYAYWWTHLGRLTLTKLGVHMDEQGVTQAEQPPSQ